MENVTTGFSGVTDTSPKIFVVLGSKRGGTSFLAQILGENGVYISTCGNGHNEDLEFVEFNDLVLKEAGGDWNNIPSSQNIGKAVKNHQSELVQLISSKKQGKPAWGWKDPRQGATIEHFLPYLPDDDVYLVCIFRKPKRVAASIKRVWDKPLAVGEKIARDYYKRIIKSIERFIEDE